MTFVKISPYLIKSPLKYWFISQISVHNLCHLCSMGSKFRKAPTGTAELAALESMEKSL